MKIAFITSGAAFCDPHTGEKSNHYYTSECMRIMQDILDKIECGCEYGRILDINGNKIGEWQL